VLIIIIYIEPSFITKGLEILNLNRWRKPDELIYIFMQPGRRWAPSRLHTHSHICFSLVFGHVSASRVAELVPHARLRLGLQLLPQKGALVMIDLFFGWEISAFVAFCTN
jgi:hypothetical protein